MFQYQIQGGNDGLVQGWLVGGNCICSILLNILWVTSSDAVMLVWDEYFAAQRHFMKIITVGVSCMLKKLDTLSDFVIKRCFKNFVFEKKSY